MNEEIYNENTKFFKKVYENLVQTRLVRGTVKKKGDGLNKHHIIPRGMGGEDIENNYVLLTFREHIIAHRLLARIYPNNNELQYAYLRMIQSSHSNRKENTYKLDKEGNKIPVNVSLKELEELRQKSVEYLRFINLGNKASEETKEILSQKHLGMKYSEDTKQRLTNLRLGKNHASNITVISPENKIFGSISIAMKELNVSREFIQSPENGFKIIKKTTAFNRKVQGPDGTIYKNITECSKLLGLNLTTIKRWIINKPHKGFKFID